MAIQTVVAVGVVVLISQILVSTHYVEASAFPIQIESRKQVRGVPIPGPNPNNPTPTTTAATATTATTTPNAAGASNKEITMNQNALEFINRVRMSHNAPPLTFDPTLQALAKICARLYALQIPATATDPTEVTEPIQHQPFLELQCNRDQTGGGNELILTVPKAKVGTAGVLREAFRTKYNEDSVNVNVKNYNFQEPKSLKLEVYQYFTQMLWKSSTKMGCACEPDPESAKLRRACSCIFNPPGNTRFGYSSAGLVDYVTNVQAKQ